MKSKIHSKPLSKRIGFLLALTVFVGAVVIVGQVKMLASQQDAQDDASGRRNRSITATISMTSDYMRDQQQFRVGETMGVRLSLTNNSPDPILIMVASNLQNRLRLLKDGEVVLYRRDLPRRLRARDRHDQRSGDRPVMVDRLITIPPGETRRIDSFNLNQWYDPLEPGQYQLTLRRHFRYERPRMPLVESNTITFEVVP